jgi:hypothetical protein
VVSTPKDMLPTPATVETIDETVTLISSLGRLPRFHQPDSALHPRRWRLTWRGTEASVGDAVRRRYDDFPYDVFSFKIPRTGEVVFALWAMPPTIQWATPTAVAGISADVEEALAHD